MTTPKTVAELTIFYKRQRLTSLIFDNQETADTFVDTLTSIFNQKGHDEFSFNGEIKTVYTSETITGNYIVILKAIFHPKDGFEYDESN